MCTNLKLFGRTAASCAVLPECLMRQDNGHWSYSSAHVRKSVTFNISAECTSLPTSVSMMRLSVHTAPAADRSRRRRATHRRRHPVAFGAAAGQPGGAAQRRHQ